MHSTGHVILLVTINLYFVNFMPSITRGETVKKIFLGQIEELLNWKAVGC